MKSFGILRTNTGLTSNIKVVIGSNYNFYLESIDSSPELSSSKLKKVQFNKDNFYDELIPLFYKDFPVDIAFSTKYDEDNYNMSNDFSNQYDDFYSTGAKNIINNKDYSEEYEYFAPLYLFKHHIPKYFIIFRVDGPGIINLSKDNFRSEFLSKMKVLKIFDLTRNSQLGEWIDKNFRNNINFPKAPLEVDFRGLEFTKWYGIDYDSGGYTNKPFFLDENLENENTLFDFERFFLDGYRTSKIIFPNILNFSFLFDDTPATPTSIRKWSLNRYSGFYIEDLEVIETVTPYNMPKLQGDVVISIGNFIQSLNFGDPFVEGFKEENSWIEYLGEFYRVIKVEETGNKSVNIISKDTFKKVNIEEVTNPIVTRYKIISELNLTGKESLLNKSTYFINSLNQIVDVNNNPLIINDIEFADINLIEINGVYHNIFTQNGFITLNTDFGFKFNENNLFSYFINSGEDGNEFTWDLRITDSNLPRNFKIYKVKFSDIKDFDTQIIDSEFSKFEYEFRNKLTRTDESKMYFTDLRSQSSPQDFDDFILDGKRELIPVSSDYTANLETFRIEGNKLSDIWRKNPIFCRWGYQNSLSSHDYPYLLNNSILHEEFNRTVNTTNSIPNRSDRNLDYFYTFNSGTTSYLHQSLHIERNFEDKQDSSFRFELDKYLELGTYSIDGTTYSYDFDYFDLILSKKTSNLDGKILLNKEKFSYLEQGDSVEPNTTLFRGLKFRLFEVDNIKFNQTNIENINLFASNNFGDYKFSIILSSNDYMVGDDGKLYKPYEWDWYVKKQNEFGNLSLLTNYTGTPSTPMVGDIIEIDQFYPYINSDYGKTTSNVLSVGTLNLGGYGIKTDKIYTDVQSFEVPGIWRNKMQWKVIKNWQYDEQYTVGDMVFYGGVIFDVISDSFIDDPNLSPITNPSEYSVSTSLSQFWNYNTIYFNGDWVYKDGEYYYYDSTGSIDFWNPSTNYLPGQYSLYNGIFFESLTFSQDINPTLNDKKIQSSNETKYWKRVSGSFSSMSKWKKIELWDRFKDYNSEFVVKDDILYSSTQSVTPNQIPGESSVWIREYSFIPDSNFIYGTSSNSVININQSFYYCIYNPELTLDSGITVYINKKWKNILVNISINDNTIDSSTQIMDETRNIERDSLYVETNGRLTAANFIRQLNDLDSIYGFADYTSYVVIEEDGSFNKFNFKSNLENLPYILFAEESDEFQLKRNSLKFEQRTLDKSVLNYSRYLIDGNIDNLEKLNYYNLTPLSVEITNIKSDEDIKKNLNGQKREIFETLRRHSGYYMPIFYDIDLFNKSDLYDRGSLCEIQFLLDIQGLPNPCPVLTIRNPINSLLFGTSSVNIPIYYVGDVNSEYSYQGQVYTQSIFVQNNTLWELSNISGVWATSSTLLGTYSNGLNISCQETDAYCIEYIEDSISQLKVTGFQIKDINDDLVGIFIDGDEYIYWNSSTDSWIFNVDFSTVGCSFSIPGTQSEAPIGTFSGCLPGTNIIIKDIKDCLPEFGIIPISGVVADVILFFETNDYQSQKTFTLNGPSGNTLQDWENFYQQIIDAISSEEIFSDRSFIFDIYEPGNTNINSNMLPGYHVLSVKYESEICDVKVSATQPNPCQSLFEFFITQMVDNPAGGALPQIPLFQNTIELTNILTQGFTLSKSDFNFCCDDCGPRQISFLQFIDVNPTPPPISIVTTPYLDFIQNEFGCPISATSNDPTSLSAYSTYSFTNSPEFLQTYNNLSSLSTFINQFGMGEYGETSLLSEVYQVLIGVSASITNWNPLIKSILEDGLVVGCDNDNYYVFNNSSYFQYIN
jgi:hypothetical protein